MIEEFKYINGTINIKLSDVSLITSIVLLDDRRRSEEDGLDLYNKVLEEGDEFEVTKSDLNIGVFSGVYVLRVKNALGQIFTEFFVEDSRFKICILKDLLKINACEDCLKYKSNTLINAFNILRSLEFVEELGSVKEAYKLSDSLHKYCKTDCRECNSK